MKRLAIAASVALACSAAQGQRKPSESALQFKGTPFGTTREQFIAAHPEFECVTAAKFAPCPRYVVSAIPGREHMGPTYGGQPAKIITAEFDDSGLAVVLITLSSVQFDAVTAELAKKYGKPQSRETSTVESVGGVKKQQVALKWPLRDGQIDATKYAGYLGESLIQLRTPKRVADDAAADVQRASEAQKDL